MNDQDVKLAARDKRLREALKTNLRRRKAQAQVREDAPPEQTTGVVYSGRVKANKQPD